MPEMAIQTQKLTRTFGALRAVDSVDLQVTPGQFFGFLGPNGAGKSTTIKILTGLLAPTSGSMELLGVDFAANPVEVKRQIGPNREVVKIAHPAAAHAANYVARKGRIGVSVRQHNHSRLHQRNDAVLKPIGEISCVDKTEGGGRQHLPLLAHASGAFHQVR